MRAQKPPCRGALAGGISSKYLKRRRGIISGDARMSQLMTEAAHGRGSDAAVAMAGRRREAGIMRRQ